MECNKISAPAMKLLSDALSVNTTLTSLVLRIYSTSDEMTILAEDIKVNSTLTLIDFFFEDHGDTDAGMIALSNAFMSNTSIQTIRIRGYQSIDPVLTNWADALNVNSTITRFEFDILNIDDNGRMIEVSGMVDLARAIKINTSISYVTIGCSPISTVGLEALTEALKINVCVSSFDLKHYPVTARTMNESDFDAQSTHLIHLMKERFVYDTL